MQKRQISKRMSRASVPGLPEVPGAVDQKTALCLMPPRPIIACKSSDGSEKNQTCKDEGPLTLECSKTVDEEISAKVVDFLDRNDPKKTNKPFFAWYNPARMHVVTVLSRPTIQPAVADVTVADVVSGVLWERRHRARVAIGETPNLATRLRGNIYRSPVPSGWTGLHTKISGFHFAFYRLVAAIE
jgi:hypothetical protein